MMINFAHRGASGYYPENTMLSFKKAIDMNCTGIETDVQMTRDGALILMHDEKINRTTNGSGYIKDYTYRELRKMDAGSWLDKGFKKSYVPLAEELLDIAKLSKVLVNLELKTDKIPYENLEERVIELVNDKNMNSNVIISSFNGKSLIKCKEMDNTIKTALLYEGRLKKPDILATAASADAVHPPLYAVNKRAIDNLKSKGFMINVWTINRYEYMVALLNSGIDGIMTDFPDMFDNVLNCKWHAPWE